MDDKIVTLAKTLHEAANRLQWSKDELDQCFERYNRSKDNFHDVERQIAPLMDVAGARFLRGCYSDIYERVNPFGPSELKQVKPIDYRVLFRDQTADEEIDEAAMHAAVQDTIDSALGMEGAQPHVTGPDPIGDRSDWPQFLPGSPCDQSWDAVVVTEEDSIDPQFFPPSQGAAPLRRRVPRFSPLDCDDDQDPAHGVAGE